MVGIVRDDTQKAMRDYVKSEDVGWTVGFDPKSKAALAYGTTGQPETFVIGPDGRVAGEQFAAVSVDNLETMLRAARRHALMRRWLPWLALGAIVVVAARRPRRAFATVELAGGPGEPARQGDRVPGVHRRVGRREQRARGARDPAGHR